MTIPLSSRQAPPCPVAAMLILVVAVAWLSSGPHWDASRLACDLALLTVAVAARERRHPAMLMAAGIACGLAPYAAMLLPIAIGVGIARRVQPATFLLIPFAAIGTATMGLPPVGATTPIGLWSIAAPPDVIGLLVAIAVGSLAWSTAALSARPLSASMLATATAACVLAGPLTLPGASMAVPVALAMGYSDRRVRILTGLAALLAAGGLPLIATLVLGLALWTAAKPLLARPANDNWAFARPVSA